MPGGNPYIDKNKVYVPPGKGQVAPRNPLGTQTYVPPGGNKATNGSTSGLPTTTNTYGATGDYAEAPYRDSTYLQQNMFNPNYDLSSVDPSQDYSYQAFLQGLGYSNNLAQSQAARQRASLQAQAAATEPMFDQALSRGLTNDLNTSAARGGVNSSARLLSQADTQNNVNNQRKQFELGIADKQAQVADSLESQLANSRIQQSQQELAARQRLLDTQNQTGLNNYAQLQAQSLLNGLGL